MRAAPTLTALGTALCFASSPAQAVGFGRISNTTQLGQQLNFSAALRLEPDEALTRDCVSAEVQSGENKLASGQVRVSLEDIPGTNDRRVRVTTIPLIDEPVVTVTVTVGCNSSVSRKFVAFVDPPLINQAQTAPAEPSQPSSPFSPSAPAVAAAPRAVVQPPPRRVTNTIEGRNRVRPPRPAQVARAVAPRAAAPDSVTPQAAKPPRSGSTSRQPTVARAAPPGPRLQLESAPVVAPRAASSPAETAVAAAALAASEAASSARADEAAGQLARERQRIQLLEDGLAKLRIDSQATQASLAAMQLRLKQAESERYANPLVYALAWLSALLALAVAGLWWRQSRNGRSQWWTPPPETPAIAPVSPAAARVGATPAAVAALPVLAASSPPTLAEAFEISTVIEEDDAAPSVSPATRPMPVSLASQHSPDEAPRELSVEELIDLEQQAEFFVVLGQDEAAIDLLMSHVRSDGGISPLPYLKLLEIYRRRGEEESYQRIRERFNRRFNAYAPDWESDLQRGRALSDYPDTIERLQGMWSNPASVMETLDASLFRRNSSDETFDLPAYRELLFLYSMARDLAEHGGAQPGGAVDLLLPLDIGGASSVSPLTATRVLPAFERSEMPTLPLDLDVSLDFGARSHDVSATRAPAEASPKPIADSHFLEFDEHLPVSPIKHVPKA
jgi:pilus assembly protein FimV